jgi:hypothetical protein
MRYLLLIFVMFNRDAGERRMASACAYNSLAPFSLLVIIKEEYHQVCLMRDIIYER